MTPKYTFSKNTFRAVFAIFAVLLVLGGCEKKEQAKEIRPVRSVVVEKHDVGDPIALTGQLHARDETSLAFRLSGKLI